MKTGNTSRQPGRRDRVAKRISARLVQAELRTSRWLSAQDRRLSAGQRKTIFWAFLLLSAGYCGSLLLKGICGDYSGSMAPFEAGLHQPAPSARKQGAATEDTSGAKKKINKNQEYIWKDNLKN